jgi:mono/diheme cytochrome c family protein
MKLNSFSTLLGITLALSTHLASAEIQGNFDPSKIPTGRGLFDKNCAPCHGVQMKDPEGAFDLRTFPSDQKNRFFYSVTNGKNGMPPWGNVFNPEQIESLWAYVVAGEKK